jgi:hypothetical protein
VWKGLGLLALTQLLQLLSSVLEMRCFSAAAAATQPSLSTLHLPVRSLSVLTAAAAPAKLATVHSHIKTWQLPLQKAATSSQYLWRLLQTMAAAYQQPLAAQTVAVVQC